MRKGFFYVLAFIAVGFMIAFAITQELWTGIGFFVAGGLMFVLYPRRSSADADQPMASSYSWMLPESQPARSIVTFLMGLFLLGAAAVVLLR